MDMAHECLYHIAIYSLFPATFNLIDLIYYDECFSVKKKINHLFPLRVVKVIVMYAFLIRHPYWDVSYFRFPYPYISSKARLYFIILTSQRSWLPRYKARIQWENENIEAGCQDTKLASNGKTRKGRKILRVYYVWWTDLCENMTISKNLSIIMEVPECPRGAVILPRPGLEYK